MDSLNILGSTVTGEGAPIIFLHGIPGSSRNWAKITEKLQKSYECHCIDLLGFGTSPRPESIQDLWVDGQASAIFHYIEHHNIQNAIWVAHDYGGPVALRCYAEKPEKFKALVLASCNTFSDTPIPFPLSTIFYPFVGQLAKKFLFSRMSLKMLVAQGTGSSKVGLNPEHYVGDSKQSKAIATIFAHALFNLDTAYAAIESTLSKVEVPTTVIWGEKDPFFDPEQGERTADAIAHSKLVFAPDAGHFTPEECSEIFVDEINSIGTT